MVKAPEGWGSKTVVLISTQNELEKFAQDQFVTKAVGTAGLGCTLAQEFVPGLDGDWKVIVVGDLACSLYRMNRDNDFRASGSGLFKFEQAPVPVLEFAFHVKEQLDAPWVACDIANTSRGCYLLENQVVHFGTTTLDKSPFHFRRQSQDTWQVHQGTPDVEEHMAEAFIAKIRLLL